jgi:tetratricopeptide (TPR) repeat protein
MTAPSLPGAPERERLFGLLLFDAEESLARGEAEKAMVLASKAVKERPDNLTARSLAERARRELLQGRRREKLEARILEARSMLEAGRHDAAERIVTSALKLIPDHAEALTLFARLKERPRASVAETEAERELERLSRAQAEKALEAARSAQAAGQFRRALSLVRRGLRQAPDHPGLLGLLREAQGIVASLDAERARRRALGSQVRAGLELLAQGRIPESLRLLRAVLREDPDNGRAQAAIQELRRALRSGALPRTRPAAPARPPSPPAPAPAAAPAAPSPPALPLRPAPTPSRPAPAAPTPGGVPVEILLPRTRRRATPATWVLAGGALILAALGFVLLQGRSRAVVPRPAPPAPAAGTAATPPAAGPLDRLPPDLRRAIEETLAQYSRALETVDEALLARARPDMSPEARARRLRPFRGALNTATDLRVIEVVVEEDRALVDLLATDVIVGGSASPRPPIDERLVFERSAGAWALSGR